MKLLSALDALFLHLETAEQPMHVGGLNTFALPLNYRGDFHQDVRSHIAERMHLAPVFHRCLATMPMGLTNPAWHSQDEIDLDWHIQKIVLRKPGSHKQLCAAVAKAHEELLPRDRPLWRMWVIQGLADGQYGFYAKFHHAALDGQGGVALAKAILDLEAHPPKRESKKPASANKATPSTGALLAASFRGLLGQYAELIKAAPQMTQAFTQVLGQGLGSVKAATGKGGSISDTFAGAASALGGLVGPKTRLNVAIGKKRAFATVSFSLAEIKQIGKAFEGSLNDAVLGIVSGGLRRYLSLHQELPDKPLVCAMPVSLRSDPNINAGSIDNQSSMVLTSLATHLDDAGKRMREIITSTQKAKQVSAAMKSGMPTDVPSLGIPWLLTSMTKLYTGSKLANRLPPVANIVVSNVPGPPVPLFMAGAQMTAYYPVSIVVHGIAMNITLQSYNGRLDFGLIACAKAVPDLSKFGVALEEAFEELKLHSHKMQAVQPTKKVSPVVKTTKPRRSTKQ